MSITGLAYLAVVGIGCLMSVSGRPFIGLLLYVFTFYFYAPGSWWGGSLPDLRWSLLSAIVTLIGLFVENKKNISDEAQASSAVTFLSRPEFKLYLALVVWIWLQSLWAIAPGFHREYAVMATKFLLLFFLMHKILITEKRILGFIVANILGCAYFGWIGLGHSSGRFESVPTPGLADGNLLSLHMVPILLLSSFLLLCNYKKSKFWLLIPIALTLNAIFLTQSRGGLVGLVIGCCLALLFRPKVLRGQINFYILLAIISAVQLVPEDLVNRLSQAAGPEEERDKSAESRLVIIEAQLNMFSGQPLLGYGHRGTLILSPDYIDQSFLTSSASGSVRGSHNLLMSLLVDFGVVGSIFYLLIIYIFARRLFKMRQKIIYLDKATGNLYIMYLGGVCALVALMVSSMFSNSLRLEIDILLIGLLSAIYTKLQSEWAIKTPNQQPINKSIA